MSDSVTLTLAAAAMGSLLAFAALAGLVLSETGSAQRARRMHRAVGLRPTEPTARATIGVGALFARLFFQVATGFGERFGILTGREAARSADLVASAGFPGRDAVVVYAFTKTVVPLSICLMGVIWLVIPDPGANRVLQVAVIAASALGVARASDLYLAMRRTRRMAEIRRAFPDMLELFVISSEAGLGLQPSLARVGEETADIYPVLSGELIRSTNELRFSNDRQKVLDGLASRIPLPEIAHFAQAVIQADRHGTSFGAAMRTLMRDQRADRILRVEERAARLPVLMTIPLIFLIMPAVFVVLVGPAVLSVLDNIIRGV